MPVPPATRNHHARHPAALFHLCNNIPPPCMDLGGLAGKYMLMLFPLCYKECGVRLSCVNKLLCPSPVVVALHRRNMIYPFILILSHIFLPPKEP